jgi:hypothetical protein
MHRVRRRPPLSCTKCRLRKLKCNRQTPCNQCVKSKSPQACHYLPTLADRPAAPPPKPTATTWAVSTPSQPPSSASKPATAAVPVNDTPRRGNPVFNSRISHQNSSRSLSPGGPTRDYVTDDLQSRVKALENDRHKCNQDAMAERVEFLSPACFHGSNGKTRFFGRSHWAVTLEFVNDLVYLAGNYRDANADLSSSTISPHF